MYFENTEHFLNYFEERDLLKMSSNDTYMTPGSNYDADAVKIIFIQ